MNYPLNMSVKPDVSAHFDEATNTITYIVKDPGSNHCAIIDSVMDIDYAAGRITYNHADALIAEIEQRVLADFSPDSPRFDESVGKIRATRAA